MWRWGRRLVVAGASTTAAVALASGVDHAARAGDHRLDYPATIIRLARCCRVAAIMTADYKLTLWHSAGGPLGTPEPEPERRERLSVAHTRNAERLKRLFHTNRGIYLKIGQHLGLMDYLLPPEIVSAMRGCFDDAPVSPWSAVQKTIQQELGGPVDSLFATFDRTPLASASLAQVHHATLADGRQVAVKVQHPSLQRMASTEIAVLESLLGLVRWVLPQADLRWLADEAKFNLPRELDFRHEAQNAARAARQTRPFGEKVVVPTVHDSLSTGRVLCMAYEPGCQVADRAKIEELGLCPRAVARLLSEVFAEMVFHHGFVHCDPHPGNVLVRSWHGHVQLILLDHGLYRELAPDVRLSYCGLWKGIVLGDGAAIQQASEALGVKSAMMEAMYPDRGGVSHTLLAAMLTQRSWDKIIDRDLSSIELPPPSAHGGGVASGQGQAARQHEEQLRQHVAVYLPGILEVLQTVDRSLLLLLKTNDCLRSACARLGARSTESYVVTAEACISALGRAGYAASTARARRGGGVAAAGLVGRLRWRLGLWRASLRVALFRAGRALAERGWLAALPG